MTVEKPRWWPSKGLQRWGREPTETSVTEFCYKRVNSSLKELLNSNKFSNTLYEDCSDRNIQRTFMKRNFVSTYLFSCSNTPWKQKLKRIDNSLISIHFGDVIWKQIIYYYSKYVSGKTNQFKVCILRQSTKYMCNILFGGQLFLKHVV